MTTYPTRMLQGLATTLRILMLLAMFVGLSAGHQFAMAEGMPHGMHATSLDVAVHPGSGPHHSDCGDHCNKADASCCLTGHCAPAFVMPPTLAWHEADSAVQHPAACMVPRPEVTELPLRPPQSPMSTQDDQRGPLWGSQSTYHQGVFL